MANRLYRIAAVNKWGDYGSILMQGMLQKQGDAYVLFACTPLEHLIRPSIYLVCSTKMKTMMQTISSNITFFPCEIGRAVELDWRAFRDKDEPEFYPQGGEPENYIFRRTPIEFCEEYWLVRPNSSCTLQNTPLTFDFTRPFPLPKIDTGVPVPNEPVFAGRYRSSESCFEYFFSEYAMDVLGDTAGLAVEFLEYDLTTGCQIEFGVQKNSN